VRFEAVSFRYPGQDRPVLDGLNLTIPAGQSFAIVGANGAGKTTIVKLLARLYEPAAGAIRVDGTDIGAIPVKEWRSRIAVVFQDFVRYEASIADNIAFGAVEHRSDVEGVSVSAERAGLADTLARLPAGLDTPLGAHLTGGVDLSGGQWQRIALARALFAVRHGASILVLDEPTANLDVRAEARFFTKLVELTRGVTTVIISHRFATVRHADTIVVLSDGQLVEQGSHAELLRLGGRYSQLFHLQAARFTDEEAVA
jgi:ATP-binding cassette subfamily B protein